MDITEIKFAVVLLTLVLAGALGGLINYYRGHEPDRAEFYYKLLLGISTSLTIPLFLHSVSSKIIQDYIYRNDSINNLFILFGYSLVAALSSERFLNSISNKVLNMARETARKTEENTQKTEQIDQAIIAVLRADTALHVNSHSKLTAGLEKKEAAVVGGMLESGKKFHTFEYLEKAAGIAGESLRESLRKLVAAGIVVEYSYGDSYKSYYLNEQVDG